MTVFPAMAVDPRSEVREVRGHGALASSEREKVMHHVEANRLTQVPRVVGWTVGPDLVASHPEVACRVIVRSPA